MKTKEEMIARVHMLMCDHQIRFKYARNSREMAAKIVNLFAAFPDPDPFGFFIYALRPRILRDGSWFCFGWVELLSDGTYIKSRLP